ncbi:MAG TPA: GAF domain-containing protein [Syntrophobacteria bacterium]|nr:GAF domain-containing protein [Syntrophobacteria bacterium]
MRRNGTEVSLLLDMNNLLLAAVQPRDILEGFLAKILAYLKLDAGRIYLLDADGEFLNLAACQGLESKRFETVKIGEGFSGKAVRTRSFTAHYVSAADERERVALAGRRGVKVVFAFPLLLADRIVGVVIAVSKRLFMPSRERVDFLMDLGHQVAMALDRARLYGNLERKEKMAEVFPVPSATTRPAIS